MSTTLLFVVFACSCFGSTSGVAFDATTTPVLTITFDGTSVLFKCDVAAATVTVAALDQYAVTKDGATAVFAADADEALGTWGADEVTQTRAKADFTSADYGTYTCALKLADDSVTTLTSNEVVLPACSAAARVVESLSMALVCAMATVLKSHM